MQKEHHAQPCFKQYVGKAAFGKVVLGKITLRRIRLRRFQMATFVWENSLGKNFLAKIMWEKPNGYSRSAKITEPICVYLMKYTFPINIRIS